MSTATKLTYLNETKSQLKDMINYGLDDDNKITSSTTFREYVSSIFNAFLEALRTPDTLFTNLPKKSGTGANITLNDTANAPMRIELGATELTQAGTPTPSSPQDVHTISGSNTIEARGKNLFDKNAVTNGKYVNSTTGELSNGTTNYNATDFIQVYTGDYIWGTTSGTGYHLAVYDKNKTFIRAVGRTDTQPIKITIASNEKYVRYTVLTADLDTQQFERGSTASTYEPYVSQTADVDLGVENLWKPIPSATKSGITCSYDSEEGCYILNGTSTGATSFYVSVSYPIGKYSLSANNDQIISGGADYLLLETSGGTSTNKTLALSLLNNSASFDVTSPITALVIVISSGKTYNNFKIYPMLEKGDKVHSFCKYGQEPIECGSIGNYENIPIRTSGKNLFDINGTYVARSGSGSASVSDGTISITDTTGYSGMYVYFEQKIPLGTTISFTSDYRKLVIKYYDNIDTLLTSGATGGTYNSSWQGFAYTNVTTLTPACTDASYYKIEFVADTNATKIFSEIMINTGSIALPYEPYGTGDWYLKKNIGKIVLDGTKIYQYSNIFGAIVYADSSIANVGGNVVAVMSNKAEGIPINDLSGQNGIAQNASTNRILIKFDGVSSYNTDELIKQYFASNNYEVYYTLATPTYTPITGTLAEQLENVYQKMLSQKGQTNISQVNNDLSFNLSVSALEDLNV